MGKRIIVQARGKGSNTYKVRRKAYNIRLKYPRKLEGEGEVRKLLDSGGHSAPIAKVVCSEGVFHIPAFNGMVEGQKINLSSTEEELKDGDILKLRDIPVKTQVYCIESHPGDGGSFIKSGGSSGTISRVVGKEVYVIMPSKKEKGFNPNCRAIVGIVAGSGRLDKPLIKAGRRYYIKKAKGKLWPRTSAVKMNVVDHPFGSGRGKVKKRKTAKRNAPPGRRIGLIRPTRTGKKR